jgi:hypothetical protein
MHVPSSAQVVNCHFQVRCEKDWLALSPTTQSRVRHCGNCQEDVYLCESHRELAEDAALGHCVAIRAIVDRPLVVGRLSMPTHDPIPILKHKPGRYWWGMLAKFFSGKLPK